MEWHELNNPVFEAEQWSIKDACLAHDGRRWHLFFSLFDQERSRVGKVTTEDFRDFTAIEILVDARDEGWIGMCSPDLMGGPEGWVMVINSWGEAPGRPNAMFVMESQDLQRWSKPRPLAHELTEGKRVIDGALAWTGAAWMLACKPETGPAMATAPDLDGPWIWAGDGRLELIAEGGTSNDMAHENFQLVQLDGHWHLLSTDFWRGRSGPRPVVGPQQGKILGYGHSAWLYRLQGDPNVALDWVRWRDGRCLDVEGEAFNTIDRINAAALWDHREVDGHFYLIFGGKGDHRQEEFCGNAAGGRPWPRGWNRLGLTRSKDLKTWDLPGQA